MADHEFHALAIEAVIAETADSRSYVLAVPDELHDTFEYVAGQFSTFRARIDGSMVARCYSMSSAPTLGEPFTVTVKRVPGGTMSNWMIDTLSPGDTLDTLRPAGLFVLRETEPQAARPIVAFAAGSGITPVYSIIKTAAASTARPITLVYANRDAGSVIFRNGIDELAARSAGQLTVHHHLDAHSGFLDPASCAAFLSGDTTADVYICGPAPFMDTVEAGLATVGVGAGQVFIERFVVPGAAFDEPARSITEVVTIRQNRRKQTIEYRAGDTLLETARRAGLNPPFSCEGGSCATCMAHLDVGAATMRVNNALSPAEVADGWVLTCQAIPSSPEVVVNYDA